jgi:hypothetical protein
MSKNTSHAPKDFGTPHRIANSLSRAPKAPANADEIWTMRKRAWRESGVVMVRPEEITDPFARQAVINAASTLYGPRPQERDAAQQETR